MHGAYGRAVALSKPASKRNAQTEACIKGSDEKIPSMRAPTDVKATAPALGAQSDRFPCLYELAASCAERKYPSILPSQLGL